MKTTGLQLIGVAGLGWLTLVSPSLATTYYLSPNGNNNWDGLTPDTAWQTFNRAYFGVGAGDTLLVRGGRYVDNYFHNSAAGTPGAPLVIKAYQNEVPVMTGLPPYGNFISAGSNVVIDGLHFEDLRAGQVAIYIPFAQNVTIRNCFFKNMPDTMILAVDSSYITIEKNRFERSGNPAGDGQGSHIYFAGVKHGRIENNDFSYGAHAAVDLINGDQTGPSEMNVIRNNRIDQHWGGGINLIRGTQRTLVEGNVVRYVGEGVDYPKDAMQIAAENNIVRNNVFAWTNAVRPANAIEMLSYPYYGWNQSCVNNRIYNNVVYGAGRSAVWISARNELPLTGNKVVNNIIYRNRVGGPNEPYYNPPGNYYFYFELYHTQAKWSQFPNGNLFENNLILHSDGIVDYPGEPRLVYFDQAPWAKPLAQLQADYPQWWRGNLEVNPGFVDAANSDFRLIPDSPARKAGAHLTRTRSEGYGTVIPVEDPNFFCDGFDITEGDRILVGGQAAQITKVDYAARTLTISSAINFAAGAPVDLAANGSPPDLGAAIGAAPPPPPSGEGALGRPYLALAQRIPLNSSVGVYYEGPKQNVTFEWSFQPLAPQPGTLRLRATGASPAAAPVQSFSPRLSLTPLNLAEGKYRVSVRAARGVERSVWASAETTFVAEGQSVARVYPNPWRADRHTGGITFDNVAPGTKVTIFTVAGQRVRQLTGSGHITWDLLSDRSDAVASGTYLFLVDDPTLSSPLRGKLAIIR